MEMSLCKHKHYAVEQDASTTTAQFLKPSINTTNANGFVQYSSLVTSGCLLNKLNGLHDASTHWLLMLCRMAHTHFYMLR